VFVKYIDKAIELFPAANLRIQRIVVNNVVPVDAAGPGFQAW
jgi:hypothetical protein